MEPKQIILLDQTTIDKIAAGEVVERPASVVKELVENAIDAGATAVTVEIKDGGSTFIRVTDNGEGIDASQLRNAFLRHSTSKIRTAEDLESVQSLGFRGEALSSVAAVSKVELLTKTRTDFVGMSYEIHGGKEIAMREVGAPDGTTIFVRQLFYNTPARKKFLKSPMTEGNYVSELMEHLALSHPSVAFRLIVNNAQKLQTAGNGRLKDAIYEIYGKQLAAQCLDIEVKTEAFSIHGFIGTPAANRGNRMYETFFVNSRYVKSKLLSRAIEDGYSGFLMQHQYPFAVLFLDFESGMVDVNVHPTKQDVRFDNEIAVFDSLRTIVNERLSQREDVARVPLDEKEHKAGRDVSGAEPFETNRLAQMKADIAASVAADSPYAPQYGYREQKEEQRRGDERAKPAEPMTEGEKTAPSGYAPYSYQRSDAVSVEESTVSPYEAKHTPDDSDPSQHADHTEQPYRYEQTTFLSEEAKRHHKIIGQVFDTYWIVEFDGSMYIIDQHAAHEKVLYERFMKQLSEKEMTSQLLSPPVIVSLSEREEAALKEHLSSFERIGYAIEPFGGREYAMTAIPGNLYHIDARQMFMEAIALCMDLKGKATEDLVTERVASISCKAAVKGSNRLSLAEVGALIDELLTLDNPYHCPHGRPTIIAMTKYELDKKFKRIV
ncbi:MAG: DNA mismatch repair endonuclease MutL [Lachnospiraceae bacterium]|nr:DNA mismatch repair endonuclease MutL [Lachnospiraceae bacterium]